MDAREMAERIAVEFVGPLRTYEGGSSRANLTTYKAVKAIEAALLSYGDAIREEDATHIDELGAILFFGLDKDERVRIRTNIANGIRSLKSTPSPPAR